MGRLRRYLNAEGSHLGSFIVLGMLLLMLAGFAISLAVVVRVVRVGRGWLAAPMNLAVCSMILVFFRL